MEVRGGKVLHQTHRGRSYRITRQNLPFSPSLSFFLFFLLRVCTFFHSFGAVERSPCSRQCCSKKDSEQSTADCWVSWCNVTWWGAYCKIDKAKKGRRVCPVTTSWARYSLYSKAHFLVIVESDWRVRDFVIALTNLKEAMDSRFRAMFFAVSEYRTHILRHYVYSDISKRIHTPESIVKKATYIHARSPVKYVHLAQSHNDSLFPFSARTWSLWRSAATGEGRLSG